MSDEKLRLALAILSGRLHPANLTYAQLGALGFDLEDGPGSDADILDAAEDVVFNEIRRAALAAPSPHTGETGE